MEIPISLNINIPAVTITNEVEIPLDPYSFIRLDGSNHIPTLWVDDDVNTFNPMEYGTVAVPTNERRTIYDFRDFEEVIISKIRIYDNVGSLNTTPMYIYGIDRYNKRTLLCVMRALKLREWEEFIFPPIKIKQLLFTGDSVGMGDRTTEFKIYGEYTPIGILPPAIFPLKPVPFSHTTGTNTYPWSLFEGAGTAGARTISPVKLNACKQYKVIRHYHDWKYSEGSPGKYTFQPVHSGSWFLDLFYESLKAEGIINLVCLQAIPQWIIDTWPVGERDAENRPHLGGKNPTDIWSYIEQAQIAYQITARYGSGEPFNVIGEIEDIEELPLTGLEGDTYLLRETLGSPIPQSVISKSFTWTSDEWTELVKIDTSQRWNNDTINEVKIGLNVMDIFEPGNENNRNWKGRKAFQSGREHAANMSAVYDGHMGTMGNGIGVKAADPNMKVSTNGLAGIHYNYFMGMIYWSMEHRGFNPDGTVNVPFDILNYHSYRNTQGSEQYQGQGRKGMAPEPSGYYESAIRLRELMWRYCGENIELILGETGYDLNTGSSQAPIPFGSYTTEHLQAIWTIRTMLENLRIGVGYTTPYEIVDNSTGGGSSNLYASCGMNHSDYTPRMVSRMITQLRNLIDDFIPTEEISISPVRVLKLEHEDSIAYLFWMPVLEDGSQEYNITDVPLKDTATLYQLAFTGTTPSANSLTPGTSYTVTATEIPKLLIVE